mgnify:CR=1 FL=1
MLYNKLLAYCKANVSVSTVYSFLLRVDVSPPFKLYEIVYTSDINSTEKSTPPLSGLNDILYSVSELFSWIIDCEFPRLKEILGLLGLYFLSYPFVKHDNWIISVY